MSTAWEFFSQPANLANITPADMGFTVRWQSGGSTMYAGQLIEYTIRPLFGLPMRWLTEITHVKEQEYFIDEQRFGPYSLWHHQHYFKEMDGGVEMTDVVYYKIPFWFLGDVANALMVRKKLEHIFDFRKKVVEQRWGSF